MNTLPQISPLCAQLERQNYLSTLPPLAPAARPALVDHRCSPWKNTTRIRNWLWCPRLTSLWCRPRRCSAGLEGFGAAQGPARTARAPRNGRALWPSREHVKENTLALYWSHRSLLWSSPRHPQVTGRRTHEFPSVSDHSTHRLGLMFSTFIPSKPSEPSKSILSSGSQPTYLSWSRRLPTPSRGEAAGLGAKRQHNHIRDTVNDESCIQWNRAVRAGGAEGNMLWLMLSVHAPPTRVISVVKSVQAFSVATASVVAVTIVAVRVVVVGTRVVTRIA